MHAVVEQAYPFTQASQADLADGIRRLTELCAKCVTHGDHTAAVRQLRIHQREHIAWERDTVWRQMIGKERRGEHDGRLKSVGVVVTADDASGTLLRIRTPIGHFHFTRKEAFFLVAVVIFSVLLNVQVVDGVEANSCFAILVFATVLWATEVCSSRRRRLLTDFDM